MRTADCIRGNDLYRGCGDPGKRVAVSELCAAAAGVSAVGWNLRDRRAFADFYRE
jgi:hypothetical protein